MARIDIQGDRGDIEVHYNKRTRLLSFYPRHCNNWLDQDIPGDDSARIEDEFAIQGIPLGDFLRLLNVDVKAVTRALKDQPILPPLSRISEA